MSSRVSTLLLLVLGVSPLLVSASAVDAVRLRTDARDRFTRAHSVATPGNPYEFSPRDGWQTINVTDFRGARRASRETSEPSAGSLRTPAKHTKSKRCDGHNPQALSARPPSEGVPLDTSPASVYSSQSSDPLAGSGLIFPAVPASGSDDEGDAPKKGDVLATVNGAVKDLSKVMKGKGKSEPVTITWYTGHDLENPSCWSESVWTPTDASFVAALTLKGWDSKPQCFKFLELCVSPAICTFVRVVDTCAGCDPGSQHVDLTRAAFGALADYDVGVLQVQMRPATDPSGDWYEDLWGPQV